MNAHCVCLRRELGMALGACTHGASGHGYLLAGHDYLLAGHDYLLAGHDYLLVIIASR